MTYLELAWRLYLSIAVATAVYAFCLCGVPEVQRRRVLRAFWAPLWAHMVGAVLIACFVGLGWPGLFAWMRRDRRL